MIVQTAGFGVHRSFHGGFSAGFGAALPDPKELVSVVVSAANDDIAAAKALANFDLGKAEELRTAARNKYRMVKAEIDGLTARAREGAADAKTVLRAVVGNSIVRAAASFIGINLSSLDAFLKVAETRPGAQEQADSGLSPLLRPSGPGADEIDSDCARSYPANEPRRYGCIVVGYRWPAERGCLEYAQSKSTDPRVVRVVLQECLAGTRGEKESCPGGYHRGTAEQSASPRGMPGCPSGMTYNSTTELCEGCVKDFPSAPDSGSGGGGVIVAGFLAALLLLAK